MRPLAELLFEGVGRGLSGLAEAADPDLPDLLAESEGRRLALVVRGTDRVLEIEVRDGALHVFPPRRIPAEDLDPGHGTAHDPAVPAAGGPQEDEGPAPVAAHRQGAGPPPGAQQKASPEGGGDARDGAPAPGTGAFLGPDLLLTGSVPDFLRFLRTIRREPPPEDPFGALEVHGSPGAKAGFAALLRRIEPDYEGLLARAVGGLVAQAAARTTLGRLHRTRKTAARIVDDVAEYLEEETRLVPDPAARARFTDDVRALIGRVAELEERLDRAARRHG